MFLEPIGIPKESIDDPKIKPILRVGLQWWGTDIRRNPVLGGNPNIWVDKAFDYIHSTQSEQPDMIFVITDCRFLSEINRAKQENAICINIIRDSVSDKDEHISETELDNHLDLFDHTLYNNGTLDQYKESIKTLFDTIFTQSGHNLI